jgi:hypothetical protein
MVFAASKIPEIKSLQKPYLIEIFRTLNYVKTFNLMAANIWGLQYLPTCCVMF